MPRFIIFGGNGMLAHAIKNHPFFSDNTAPDIAECDITDFSLLQKFVSEKKSDYIINCAAYTDVTRAENEKELAMKINAHGAKNLAIICEKYHLKLIHFSTDFVFKGDKEIVYTEETPPDPVNVYGLSKLKGEEYVLKHCPQALIIRISWLYGENGNNFVSTISRLMLKKPHLKIVADQWGKTTYTCDVADALKKLIECHASGIFHFANDGVSSRYTFSRKIYEILLTQTDLQCEIIPINAIDYPDNTPRPKWSILGCEKFESFTATKINHWETALTHFLSQKALKEYIETR